MSNTREAMARDQLGPDLSECCNQTLSYIQVTKNQLRIGNSKRLVLCIAF